jgi:hypothetical protein
MSIAREEFRSLDTTAISSRRSLINGHASLPQSSPAHDACIDNYDVLPFGLMSKRAGTL